MSYGQSTFPESIDTFTTKYDTTDNVMAQHVNKLQDSVTAIQTYAVDTSTISAITEDVVLDVGNKLNVLTGTGKQVKVKDGTAIFGGKKRIYVSDTNLTVAGSTVGSVVNENKTTNSSGVATLNYAYMCKADGTALATTADITAKRVDNGASVTITAIDTTNGTITTNVNSTPIYIDYKYFTKRYDIVVINSTGVIELVQGTGVPNNGTPTVPSTPAGKYKLANVLLPCNFVGINQSDITFTATICKTLNGLMSDKLSKTDGGTVLADLTISKNTAKQKFNRPSGQTGQYAGITVMDNNVIKGEILWDFTNSQFIFKNASGTVSRLWHEGNDGAGSGLDADRFQGKSPTDFVQSPTQSGTITATGWYRVASSISGVSRNHAIFEIDNVVSGNHGKVTLIASNMYSSNKSIAINQLGYSNFSDTTSITKARIVYNPSYSGTYAHLEVYVVVSGTNNPVVTVKTINATGWGLISPTTAGGIPTNYLTREITFQAGIGTTADLFSSNIFTELKQGSVPSFKKQGLTYVGNFTNATDGGNNVLLLHQASDVSATLPLNNGLNNCMGILYGFNSDTGEVYMWEVNSLSIGSNNYASLKEISNSGHVGSLAWIVKTKYLGVYYLAIRFNGDYYGGIDFYFDGTFNTTSPSGSFVGIAYADGWGVINGEVNGAIQNVSPLNYVYDDALHSTGSSFVASGYQKLSNGFIIQWGQISITTSLTAFNYPIAFPTACLQITGSPRSGAIVSTTWQPFSTTQFKAQCVTTNHIASFMAIGY